MQAKFLLILLIFTFISLVTLKDNSNSDKMRNHFG